MTYNGSFLTAVAYIGLRQGSGATSTEVVDNLKVGTTFGSVCGRGCMRGILGFGIVDWK